MLHVVATILRTTIDEIRAHEHGLTVENFALVRPGEQIAVDWEWWLSEEKRGGLTSLAAWEARRLVGYSVWTYHGSAVDGTNLAVSAAVYHKRPFGMRRLVSLSEQVANGEGATRFCWRTAHEPFGRLLRRMGSRLMETTYVREL